MKNFKIMQKKGQMNLLRDEKAFDIVEKTLIENGKMADFEKEYGKIKGRMMVTLVDIPENLEIQLTGDKLPYAFEASFDFYDASVGLALYTDTMQVASGLWITPQKENAEPPSDDWINFFIEKLLSAIRKDGSFGIPIYSFVNDTCDMTIIPTL